MKRLRHRRQKERDSGRQVLSALPPPPVGWLLLLAASQSGIARAACMSWSRPATRARPLRTSHSRSGRPPDGLAGTRRGHLWHQGARQAAWAGCAAQGRGPARVRHRGSMVGVSAGAITARPDRSAGRAYDPADIDLYLHQQALDKHVFRPTGTPYTCSDRQGGE